MYLCHFINAFISHMNLIHMIYFRLTFYDHTYAAYIVDWHKRNKRECHHVCNANTCI